MSVQTPTYEELEACVAEQKLRQSRTLLKAVFDGTQDAIFVKDLDGSYLDINNCAAAFIGRTPAEIVGQDDTHLFPENDALRIMAMDRQVMESGESRTFEETVSFQGRAVTLFTSKSPLRDADGKIVGLIGIARDITQHKLALEVRERIIKELRAKNEELERFAYTASHDLRNPLVTIRGFTALLVRDSLAGDSQRMQHDIDRIAEAAGKMEVLLDNLLELSRIGLVANPTVDVSLAELAVDAIRLSAGSLGNRQVDVRIAANLPVIHCDRPRMLEVLQNLIDNAAKFMGDQTHPRIEIGVEYGGDQTIHYVQDNGIGIDPRYHKKVFGLFNRLNPEVRGSGIGLALVRRIIESHGGRIWVESEGDGRGSRFCFTIS